MKDIKNTIKRGHTKQKILRKPRQLSFLPPTRIEHGGDIHSGKRKEKRPIDSKRPIHIVLRSTRAKGAWSLLHHAHKGKIHALVYAVAELTGVRIYNYANVGNHVHLLIKTPSHQKLKRYLRILPSKIMFLVTGARKGNPVGKFWDKTVYTRLITWGVQFERLKTYLSKNILESLGFRRRSQTGADLELQSLLIAGLRPLGPPLNSQGSAQLS